MKDQLIKVCLENIKIKYHTQNKDKDPNINKQ